MTQRECCMIRSGLRIFTILACITAASACAVSQPSPPARDVAIADISVSQAIDNDQLSVLDDVAVDTLVGDEPIVRWGGSIASVMNRADGSTLLEIVSRPLYSGGRPIHDDRSEGRFLALIDDFLDPEIVTAGRDMTVLGRLTGKAAGKVGESDYLFPVLLISDYRFWKPVVTVPPRHFPHWNRYPPFGHADPFRRDWPFDSFRKPGRR